MAAAADTHSATLPHQHQAQGQHRLQDQQHQFQHQHEHKREEEPTAPSEVITEKLLAGGGAAHVVDSQFRSHSPSQEQEPPVPVPLPGPAPAPLPEKAPPLVSTSPTTTTTSPSIRTLTAPPTTPPTTTPTLQTSPPADRSDDSNTTTTPAVTLAPVLTTTPSPSGSFSRGSGLLAYAAAAIDNFSSSRKVKPRRSLNRLSVATDPTAPSSEDEKKSRHRASLRVSLSQSTPPSQPYADTDTSQPQPSRALRLANTMHQTSSRLLRTTDDERPFTKDFKDLFATLIVSMLPLSSHRVRLSRVEHTFMSEDCINNLGSLKFSQSNRMPDPKDTTRVVTTTTTTTFSMAREMARGMCQRFIEARMIESADGKFQSNFSYRGTVWKMTPKGISILDTFAARNGIQERQIPELVGSTVAQLVTLEREPEQDRVVLDRPMVEVIFGRFIGMHSTNVKSSTSAADSDSLSDYRDGLTGVKMAAERKIGGKIYKDTFTGKAASDWILECSTAISRTESDQIASLFVQYDLMEAVQQDRAHIQANPSSHLFQSTKHAIYQMTARGRGIVNGTLVPTRFSEGGETPQNTRPGIARDSNTQRLDKILTDSALRLLFRENLRETHCEENLSFYLDVDEFVKSCRQAIRTAQKNSGPNGNAESQKVALEGIKEIMAQAYGIYNAFLAPGSPCELNIDHQLRNQLATRMTKTVGQDATMIETLQEVCVLFEEAQNAVFKLMASDSVPKFLRSRKYEQTLKNYDFDSVAEQSPRVPERSQSRSQRL